MRVDGSSVATRWSQASASSVPPPMQKPRIAATVVQGSSATRWNTCWPRRSASSTLPARSKPRTSPMSAPAMNPLSFPDLNTSPFGGSAAIRSSNASSSSSTTCASVFTDSLSRSSVSTSTPSGRACACQWRKRRPSNSRRLPVVRGLAAGAGAGASPGVTMGRSGVRGQAAIIPTMFHPGQIDSAAMPARTLNFPRPARSEDGASTGPTGAPDRHGR